MQEKCVDTCVNFTLMHVEIIFIRLDEIIKTRTDYKIDSRGLGPKAFQEKY